MYNEESLPDNAGQRDKNIDTLRGFAMMYVVFIHCLYWIVLFNGKYISIIRSLFLIEMPLFFFITGASNALGRKRKLFDFYFSRFQRILLPYWIYGLICIALTVIAQKTTGFEQSTYFSLSIPTVFVPVSNVPYLTGALWFVPVYLYIIIIFPFLRWYYERHENDAGKFIPLLIFPFLLSNNGWEALYDAKMLFFYSFWTYLGLFFQKIDILGSIKSKIKVIPVVILCAIAVLWFLNKGEHSFDMQNNKFPPNIVFLVYTAGALLTFYLFSKYIITGLNILRKNKITGWIYKQYIENCYSMFLYHPLSFLALYVFLKYSGLDEYVFQNRWICLFVYIIITIPATAIIGKIFSWTEKIKIKTTL
ncbi:MAG: acyltransferase [Dysgonamonadaceae bacterium]|nr:acyltransferase [Dysgonamonadaceae bacterium]